ncbi:MAG: CDP-alcohol phosphatidyltransferase family protein [Phycisphaerae bacterium]|nr:CDP-alcohol phosphatidyltransferase family protein [Phycisphaerae bacterium]
MAFSPPPPTDRRPLASRSVPLFSWLARRLGTLGISPNTISIVSVVFAAVAALALAQTPRHEGVPLRVAWLAAATCVQLRLLANMLDGMVAVEGGKASATGELYNEIPDRISDPLILIGAGYALGSSSVLGYLAAVLALLVAYVRALGTAAGAANDFCGPMAKPHRMFLITLGCLYCGLAPATWQPVHATGGWGVMAAVLGLIIFGSAVTAGRRTIRIAAALEGRHR